MNAPANQMAVEYGENEAAVLDAFVVPSYLRLYWELSKQLLLIGQASRVVHLECRTGFPHSEILDLMPNTELVGTDPSTACLNLAAARAEGMPLHYHRAAGGQTELEPGTFSHALLLHPTGGQQTRLELFAEAARLLYQGGQALVSLPLSQAFPELVDLLAEYALKNDELELSRALEGPMHHRATVETVSEELEAAGFGDVDFELGSEELVFDSGRSLLEDPSARFFILPQISAWLEGYDIAPALDYVARAIDKYWSDERMSLEIRLAAFSARR